MTEEQNARLSSLFDGALLIDRLVEVIPGFLYVYDLVEARNVFANRPMVDLLGYSAEQVQAMGERLLASILHPDDLERALAHHAALAGLADGQIAEIEYRVRAADGSWRWLHSWESVLARDGAGRPRQILGVAQDVSARVRTEDDLRSSERRLAESEQRWRSIAENPFDFVVVIDRSYKYTYVNFVASGLTQGDLIGKATPFDFVAASDHAVMRAAFNSVFNDGQASAYDVYVPTLDKWFSSLVGPIRHGDVVTHASILTREITDDKRREQQARQAEEQVRAMELRLAQAAKLEAVGQLAGGIAHDFNNLLTGIAGVAELLAARLAPDDPHRQDVADLRQAVTRGAALTRQLLAFSRQQTISPTVIDLNLLLEETARMLRRLMGGETELVFSKADEPLFVRSDRTQLEQVLVNLALNARDAMPTGGRLEISLAGVNVDDASQRASMGAPLGRYAQLRVKDAGIGMDGATLAHIFEPFFTTKAVGAGTGLGLSMVHGIVKQSGGFIEVSSAPGLGSTFLVHLPVSAPEAAARDEPVQERPRGQEKVFLVEDEDLPMRLTRRLLELLGYRVEIATRGDDALAKIEAGLSFDVLLTDVRLPGMNGRELYERACRLRPGLPVVFVSGYAADVFAEKHIEDLGATFLQKPFTHDSLAAAVRSALDARKARGA